MNLVIVESPSKAKTINKYLGKGYSVIASKGHVVDLPKSELGIDVEKNFKPKYVVTKKDSLKKLKDEYKKADKLILAVDMDREGEAIGWHIAQELGAIDAKGKPKPGKTVERIVFHEISKDAINEAMASPRAVNMDLVDSQQARRVLDRLVGYKLSPLLWKKIAFGLSAGRVQSVALRLIVEREEEREAFKAEEYWTLHAFLKQNKSNKVEISFRLQSDENEKLEPKDTEIPFVLFRKKGKSIEPKTQKEIEAVLKDIDKENWIIDSVEAKQTQRMPSPPLITSTLQRLGVNMLGMSASRIMSIAQKLYEAGHITYMRTDSVVMSEGAIKQARNYILKNHGEKYIPEKPVYYANKSKNAQEAHECIRPVYFMATASKLDLIPEQAKVYNLIRERALASQMTPARLENITAVVKVGDYDFKSNGKRILFDGFLAVTKEKFEEVTLPELNKGQELYPTSLTGAQHFTKPPARYSEASLIKKLEELGIGRPSTYASIISTIQARKYVEKDGKYLFPTDIGRVVNKLLVKYFEEIVNYGFTANLEDDLDKIADGKLEWVKMISEFYGPFEKKIEEKEGNIKRDEFTVLGKAPKEIVCPECGSPMEIKLGRFGKFYSCVKFPDCKGMRSMSGETEKDVEEKASKPEFKEMYEEAPQTEDKRPYILKKGKFGEFWAHPDYPKVKDAKPLVVRPEKLEEIYGEVPKTKDGRAFLLRSGKFGKFWAHPDYPEVKEVIRIKKKLDQD